MAHNSKPKPTTERDTSKVVKPHGAKRSVGTHKTASRTGLSAGQQAATYYARKANDGGRQPLG